MTAKTLVIANSLSGALGLLAFPPLNWYWLGLVFLVPHFVFLAQETRPWRLFWGVCLFRSILVVGLVYYFFEPIFYATNVLLFAGIVPVLLLVKRCLTSFVRDPSQRSLLMMVVIGCCYLVFEYLQARYSFLPLFAMTSGAPLGDSPFVGLARFEGVVGLAIFVIVVNAVFAGGWLWAVSRRSQAPVMATPGKLLVVGILNSLLIGGGLRVSQHLLAQNRAAYEAKEGIVNIAVVSVSQAFAQETQAKTVEDYETTAEIIQTVAGYVHTLTEALRQHGTKPDLIVFPEDMIDFEFWAVPDPQAHERFTITNAGPAIALYRSMARQLQRPVLFVLTTIEQAGRYNSALLMDETGDLTALYHKNDLAFAMESWPFGRFHPFYFDWRMDEDARYESPIYNPAYRYRAGDSASLFQLSQGLTLGTPICIEVHYPYRMREFVRRGADVLVNTSSNMSSRSGLRLYLDETLHFRRIEAVWLGIPIIFCGRRDDAGIVFPDGTADLVSFSDTEAFQVYQGTVRY